MIKKKALTALSACESLTTTSSGSRFTCVRDSTGHHKESFSPHLVTECTIRCCMPGAVSIHTQAFTTAICGSKLVFMLLSLSASSTFGCQYVLALFLCRRSCLRLCGQLVSRLDEYSGLCVGLVWGGGHTGTMNYVLSLSHRSAEQAVGISKRGPTQTQTHSRTEGGRLPGEDGQQPSCAGLMTRSGEAFELIGCLP